MALFIEADCWLSKKGADSGWERKYFTIDGPVLCSGAGPGAPAAARYDLGGLQSCKTALERGGGPGGPAESRYLVALVLADGTRLVLQAQNELHASQWRRAINQAAPKLGSDSSAARAPLGGGGVAAHAAGAGRGGGGGGGGGASGAGSGGATWRL